MESKRGKIFLQKDWTEGSIIRNLLMLSWPILISHSLNMLGPTIDLIWVGKLGSASMAGVGMAGTIVMFFMSAMMGLSQGARAMVARFIGAKDSPGANNVAIQSFIVSFCYSLFIISIGLFLSETLLIITGVDADVVSEGAAYMQIMFVCGAARAFRMMAESIMQSSGDAVTPMKISVLFRIVHIIVCPFLVFGLWIFPHLGVRGAALSDFFAQTLGLVIGLWILFSGRTRLSLTLKNVHIDLAIIWRIVKIGIPVAVMGMQRGLGQFLLMFFMVPFGTAAVAAHTILHRIEMMLVMLCMGLGTSAGVLAGQNMGAGKPKRAEKSGWLAACLAEGVMLFCSAILFIWPEPFVRIFNSDPSLVAITTVFLRIGAIGYLMLGCGPLFMHVLSGMGDTMPPMLIAILQTWLVLMPLAFFLPMIGDLGMYGVRWAITIAMYISAILYVTYFRSGRWKNKVV
ncbi:MAG: MATE family efflux transporter [Deltaproteobacteria bacterium]|nr:MATE family efflux transporter [Deltaproteobacteria bacterium]